jgi:hypothetical protein
LRRVRRIAVFQLERLPQPLQLENQRRTLRPDRVVMGFTDPARRAPAVMRYAVSASHGSTLSTIGARRAVLRSGATAGCRAAAGCLAAAGSFVTAGPLAVDCPVAVRTRANISSHGPNAMDLPS